MNERHTPTYYLLRHERTGAVMRLRENNKGYSHWEPGAPEDPSKPPRLFTSVNAAIRAAEQWSKGPRVGNTYLRPDTSDNLEDLALRDRHEMEVVPVRIRIVGPAL